MPQLQKLYDWIGATPPLFAQQSPFVSLQGLPSQTLAPSDYKGNPRLGFIYQYLCAARLASSPRYQVCLEELQLNDAKGQTQGAIDFILRNLETERCEHWEVAIKFYLLHHGRWYGPNAHDQLDKKLGRMVGHQLKMSSSPQFAALYPQLLPLSEHVLLQGRLYINPFEQPVVPEQCLGFSLEPSQISGYWCYQRQAGHISQPLYALDKRDWATGLSDFCAPLTHFEGKFVHAQSADGQFWFVVADSWPQV